MKCELCLLDKATVDGCTYSVIRFTATNGAQKDYIRKPYGSDALEALMGHLGILPERCGDCRVRLQQFHHICCDIERCPRCGGQFLGCSCNEEGTFTDIAPGSVSDQDVETGIVQTSGIKQTLKKKRCKRRTGANR